jgi:PAS domain S-box-containing protein
MKAKDAELLRLAALEKYKIMDTVQEEIFDSLTTLASSICGTKISLISLLDHNRQWFKSKIGIEVEETPIENSFCQYAIQQDDVLVIPDASKDSRTKDSPMVTGDAHLRFYAGMVLKTPDGYNIGTLCVADDYPRELTEAQKESLRHLGRLAISLLESRIRSEELLEERKKNKLSLEIIDASPDFIGTCDLKGNITHYNKAFSHAAKRVGEDKIFAYLTDKTKEYMRTTGIPAAIKNGFWRGETAIIDHQDREVPVLLTLVCHKNDESEPVYFSSVMHDITLLRENSLQFRALADLAPVGIYVTDKTGYPTYVNRQWLQTAGMSLEEALDREGLGSFAVILPDDRKMVAEEWTRCHTQGLDFELDFRMWNQQTKDISHIKSRATSLKNLKGEITGFIGANLDITEQKKLEIKLKRSVRQMGNFIENLPAAVAMVDRDLNYIAVSRRWITAYALEIGGYNEENIIGKSHYDVFPGLKEEYKENHRQVLGGKVLKKDDDNFIRHDGRLEWLNWDVRPWYDENGKIGGMIMLTDVITEKKNAEMENLQAKASAQRASAAKSQFLANMSHEIRTPLNSIIGLTDLLSESKLEPEQAKQLGVIQQSGEILLSLINNILDLSKIEAGELNLESIDLNFEDLIEKIVGIFAFQSRERQIDLNYDLPEELPHYKGDPSRINQILINLLGNAIKFTPGGKVTVTITKNTSPTHPGNILVSIKDNGVGIDPAKHKLIFENFGQAESTTTRNFGGTGLGLAITKNLVQMMGGEIWVESDLGRGSNFLFTLDLLVIDHVPWTSPDLTRLKLLLFQNEFGNLAILENHIKSFKIPLTTARSVNECLQELTKGSYDVFITDTLLDGEFKTKQILLTLEHESDLALRNRPSIYPILKPYTRKELLLTISEAVELTTTPLPKPSPLILDVDLEARELRILLVDDSQENRDLILAFLKKYPFKITTAQNGEEALGLLKKSVFDICFMDMQMPVMDGLTATRNFRKWEKEYSRRRTPVIALTAFALQEEMAKSLEAGCDSHLTKPIKKATIIEALKLFT